MFCPNNSNQKSNLKVPIPVHKHLFSSGSAAKNGFIRSSESKQSASLAWKEENEDYQASADFFM